VCKYVLIFFTCTNALPAATKTGIDKEMKMKTVRQILSVALWVVCGVALVKTGQAAWLVYSSVSTVDSFGGLASGFMMIMTCLFLLVSIAVGLVASKVWAD